MKARLIAVLILLVVAASALIAPRTRAAQYQVPLELGYSPSILFPVSGGTPVYTAGDQLWVMSHYNAAILIRFQYAYSFLHSSLNRTVSVGPGVPVRVLTFNSTNQGLWSMQSPTQLFPSTLLEVSDTKASPANLTLSSYELAGGSLRLNLTTSPALQMYGAEACVLGGSDDSTARVDIPSAVGSGYVNVSLRGQSLEVFSAAAPGANYTLSVELYRSFSFLLPNSTALLVSRTVRVASTGSVLMTGRSAGPTVLPLETDLPLAPGTYQLRAFFENGGGVFLGSTTILVTPSGGAVWSGGCRTYPVYAGRFALTIPLGSHPSGWPRSVWLTYSAFGEEGVAYLPLVIPVSTVSFVGAPWGVRLTSYDVALNSTSGVRESEVGNGTIIAILDAPTAQMTYSVRLGGQTVFSGAVGPVAPFTASNVTEGVSKLDVQYLVGGKGYGGGAVRVSDRSGVVAKGTTDDSGLATFYLPTGRYNVTAAGGNSSAAGSASVVAGQSEQLVLGGGGGGPPDPLLLAALSVAAAAGLAANVGLWFSNRKPSAPPAGAQGPSPSQK